jgi:two-component system nitrogen regulation response regulator NtrX
VEVNCAAIPEELIESELLGHVKGSFTGAHESKTGKFQQADGGTLFLDEVGDMSLNTQAKVLRVLEEQRFEPVGSGKTVQVDVRVIAATNKNLENEILRGNFRDDLFYRLNVIPFHVPPLRERAEDIPLLADYFLREFAAEYGRKPKTLTDAARAALLSYTWPGNVRELRNLVEGMVVFGRDGRPLDVGDLPTHIRTQASPHRDMHMRVGMTMTEVEKVAIEETLKATGYDKQRTAEMLEIGLRTLYRKMKQYEISG